MQIAKRATRVAASLSTLRPDARKCGRANGKEEVARPRYQDGSLFIRGKRTKVWVARWREDLIREDGTLHRTQRTVVLGAITDLSRREARSLLQKRVSEINQGRHRARPIMTLEKFAREHWQAGALLALKPSSARIYTSTSMSCPHLDHSDCATSTRQPFSTPFSISNATAIQDRRSMEYASRLRKYYRRPLSMDILNSIQPAASKSGTEHPASAFCPCSQRKSKLYSRACANRAARL